MNKEEKEVLKYLVGRELNNLKVDEKNVSFGFSSPDFIESMDKYGHILREILKKLK